VVAPQLRQSFIRAGEDLLEHVLGVVLWEPEAAAGDRVDVAREALHELVPGVGIPRAAPRDELCIGLLNGHRVGRYDFGAKSSAQSPVEGRDEQLGVFIFERQWWPDLERVVVLPGESDEDSGLA